MLLFYLYILVERFCIPVKAFILLPNIKVITGLRNLLTKIYKWNNDISYIKFIWLEYPKSSYFQMSWLVGSFIKKISFSVHILIYLKFPLLSQGFFLDAPRFFLPQSHNSSSRTMISTARTNTSSSGRRSHKKRSLGRWRPRLKKNWPTWSMFVTFCRW